MAGASADLARLFALGANDLRTPLATLSGYARTLAKSDLDETARGYVVTIEETAAQLRDVADALALVARIEEGRFTPTVQGADSLELVNEAASRFAKGHVAVSGRGGPVRVERIHAVDALAALTRATMRHGGLDDVVVTVEAATVTLAPVAPNARPVLAGDEVREFGAAVALIVLEAMGVEAGVRDDVLVLELPQ